MPKMPHNNRVSASVALRTNSMWSKTIGHDPYASKESSAEAAAAEAAASEQVSLEDRKL